MSSPDRLAELRRQRGLVADHLAWLDRQIADAEASIPSSRTSGPSPAAPTAPAMPVPANTIAPAVRSSETPSATDSDSDTILDQFRAASGDVQRDVRKGCLLYFAAAMLALAGLVAVLYFALSR